MGNIFEGAKFGDKFVTRDGKIAILISCYPKLDIATLGIKCESTDGFTIHEFTYQLDGKHDAFLQKYDIVSCYQEPIDEEKVSKFADEEMLKVHFTGCLGNNPTQVELFDYAYKKGYRKAKEE